jgi:hypothetical protein
VNITNRAAIMEWVDRASAPGLGYGISKEEIDQWSAERKAITAQGGRLLDAEFPTVLHATPLVITGLAKRAGVYQEQLADLQPGDLATHC